MEKLSSKAIALLKGKNFVSLGTINRDGSPHVTTLWVDTDGRNVLVNTAKKRVKDLNVARDPRVSLAVFDLTNPYYRLHLDGKVVKQITGKKADDHIDSLSAKYTGVKKYKKSNPTEHRVIYVIEPTHIREQ